MKPSKFREAETEKRRLENAANTYVGLMRTAHNSVAPEPISAIQAIDYARPRVSGGRHTDPIQLASARKAYAENDRADALAVLAELSPVLGERGVELLRLHLAERFTFGQIAELYQWKNYLGARYIGARFDEAIKTVAAFLETRFQRNLAA